MGKKGKHNNNQKYEEDEPKKKKFMITEEHLMDKTHMDNTEFVSFIPSDSLYFPYTLKSQPLRTIVKDLNYLLYLDFKNFWATLLYNPSLKNCLTTCLQFFHRKWLNKYEVEVEEGKNWDKIKWEETTQYTQQLMKLILFIYFRMVHCVDEGPQLSKLYKLEEEISKKYLLNIPRLLEIIQIYGQSNPDIVKVIVKNYAKTQQNLYSEFTKEILQIMITKMNKNINYLKRISDREEFGINYSYKRMQPGQLSPGQQQLKKKMCLLMEILSFYENLENSLNFFPQNCVDYIRFEPRIHLISQNIFIEIQQAYKIWDTHENSKIMHAVMNAILKKIKSYFLTYFQYCQRLIVNHQIKSGTIGAYVNSLERIFQNYGKRITMGKKLGNKRFLELFQLLAKQFDFDKFLTPLYMDEMENGTYGINIEYLVDFKVCMDDITKKKTEKPPEIREEQMQMRQPENQTEDDASQKAQERQNPQPDLLKYEEPKQQELQIVVSKKNREENYYEKLYSEYRTKIQVEYDDQYDDLLDYEKKPAFLNIQSSDSDLDSEEQKLHLVKNQSNSSRDRAHMGTKKQQKTEKYNRKGKALYVPVKEHEAKKIVEKNKKTYTPKDEYEDEECFQECKVKIAQERVEEPKKYVEKKSNNQKKDKNKFKKKYIQKQ